MSKRVVVALGGNAILQPKQEATFRNQKRNIEISCTYIAELALAGHQLIMTHGNGPQVGNILRQNELGSAELPPLPMRVCCAKSQGFIGYMMEQSLKNLLSVKDAPAKVVTLLIETEVDPDDGAFQKPTKPIGKFYTKKEAETLCKTKDWLMGVDANKGYRRLVPSPQPQKIHGVEVIKLLVEQGVIVISTGGGGIPVIKNGAGQLIGVDAVIDKDRSALLLAKQVEAEVLMILTDTPYVYLNYGTSKQRRLDKITVNEAEAFFTEGHFLLGSMGPKMEAAIAFAKSGGEAIICSLDEAGRALAGMAGTHIIH